MGFETELSIMSQLDVMLSMDSANMHLASLVNTPVISIWGATHPYAGFMGWRQDKSNTVEIELPCRPCSIFGNKPCWRKDYACLYEITPEMIIEKIKGISRRNIKNNKQTQIPFGFYLCVTNIITLLITNILIFYR